MVVSEQSGSRPPSSSSEVASFDLLYKPLRAISLPFMCTLVSVNDEADFHDCSLKAKCEHSWQKTTKSLAVHSQIRSDVLSKLTIAPQLDSGVSDDGLQHAQCADPAALDSDATKSGAGGCDQCKALVAEWAVADLQSLQGSHAGDLYDKQNQKPHTTQIKNPLRLLYLRKTQGTALCCNAKYSIQVSISRWTSG